MRKKDKYGFGIFEDGKSLKVAHIEYSKGMVYIKQLAKTELEKPIYLDEPKKKGIADKKKDISKLESLETIDFNNLKEAASLEKRSSTMSSIVSPYENLLSRFKMDQGVISLNANDKHISVSNVKAKVDSLSFRKLIKLKILKKEEKKEKTITFGKLKKADNSYDIILHKGENKLFNYVANYNQSRYKSKFRYAFVESNDVSLLNLINLNYDFSPDEHTLLLYIGNDYKKVMLLKGNSQVTSFNIVANIKFQDAKEIILSKLMLMHDEGEIPNPQNIILCGEYTQNSDVDFFKKYYHNSNIDIFRFNKTIIQSDISEEKIAEFSIPITLAILPFIQNSPKINAMNLIEKNILENQNTFTTGIVGYLLLFLVFIAIVFFTKDILSYNSLIKEGSSLKNKYMIKISANKAFVEKQKTIYSQINGLKNKMEKQEKFLKDKNKYSTIFDALFLKYKNIPNSWLTNIRMQDSILVTIGYTDKLENIVTISQIFQESKIKSSKSEHIASFNVWNFEIEYPYSLILKENIPIRNDLNSVQDIRLDYNKLVESYNTNDIKATLNLIKLFEKTYPTSNLKSNVEYLKGEIYYKSHNNALSKKILSRIIKNEFPLKPYAIFMLGKIYFEEGNNDLSKEYLDNLCSLYPTHELKNDAENILKKMDVKNE